MKRFRTFVMLLVILLVPVLLMLTGVRLMMLPVYMNLEYQRPDFPPDEYGFTPDDRLHYGPVAIDYLVYDQPISALADLTFAGGAPFYNARELGHMADVQRVTQIAFKFTLALIIVFAAGVLFLMRSEAGRFALWQGLMGGALLTLLFIGGMALFTLLAWDSFFTQFHELFFSQGSWTFNYDDSLIRLYPVRFWQDTAINIGVFAAFGALAILGGCWWWARRRNRA